MDCLQEKYLEQKMNKITVLTDAIRRYVRNKDSLYIAGFTHLIDFAAAHEIIRQGIRDLTLIRMTPDIIYDQMVAAGSAAKLVFSYLGNPGIGSLHCIRRSIEKSIPQPLALEEYTHGSLISALYAGGSGIPFFPVKAVQVTDLPRHNDNFRLTRDPFSGQDISVVKPLNPDVSIIHVQRADSDGNAQIWGILGEQKEAAFASKKVIVTAEEIVDSTTIKNDPNRTIIPGFIVSAVVENPWGSHPSYAQGFYDRDNKFYFQWDKISRNRSATEQYIEEWIYGLNDREEYLGKLGTERVTHLKMKERMVISINYGRVR